MNRQLLTLTLSLSLTFSFAQTTSDFESFGLSVDNFLNGSNFPLGHVFFEGNAILNNYYDTAFGGFWSKGWAISTMRDDTTVGFTNLYSAYPAQGTNSSITYAVGQQNAAIAINGDGGVINGFYVTNSTYAYLSMLNGDAIAKQFGGPSGNDPDFFKLTVTGRYIGTPANDSVEFYLADYRSSDNSQDYIIDDWQWVDLTPLGNVDILSFTLSSSDTGQFGINTPTFFCIDNFITADSKVSLHENKEVSVSVYPNPARDFISLEIQEENLALEILNSLGQSVQNLNYQKRNKIDISSLPAGRYFIKSDIEVISSFVKY